MKTCPHCAAINQEYDPICGICGESLSGVASKSPVSLETEPLKEPTQLPSTRKRKIRPKELLSLAIGLASISSGIYLLFDMGLVGLILLFIGVPTVAYALGLSQSPVLAENVWTRRRELDESTAGERPEGKTD